MSGLLGQIFGCCLRNRSPSPPTIPDEHTRLLDDPHELPHPILRQPPDHQKLKERLDSIVRAKGGKMVRVNAHAPFRLRPSDPLADTLDPSSSRSPLPSPSPSTLSLSAVDSSLASLPPPPEHRPPLLNARLVEPESVLTFSRGRPRSRRVTQDTDEGAEDVQVSVEAPTEEEEEGESRGGSRASSRIDSLASHEHEYDDDGQNHHHHHSDDDHDQTTLAKRQQEQEQEQEEEEEEEESDVDLLKTPQPVHREFVIRYQDAGSISRSWGDPQDGAG
ncbi:hypothetical protein PUNSTDRAFT_124657 [Punctularia strigosozonata HHB-11173 SS5]|uniref:uncharacterized protein n=1 Tax=Punctularia strigosozonata (strain HHB-11173) TaxID=741275 RepID=UPI0004417E77|nr:uncharacterized protein PUNSTDRAFT_124657 [Punctularia strigosozonata HHB-11173 SS5]EIN11176.1 hypothetical protein PUNSTDRAFT_124657 [Punctularia strigosozonata HHB-11173 SS5]